jgi:hypothetical protein
MGNEDAEGQPSGGRIIALNVAGVRAAVLPHSTNTTPPLPRARPWNAGDTGPERLKCSKIVTATSPEQGTMLWTNMWTDKGHPADSKHYFKLIKIWPRVAFLFPQ